MIIPSSEVKRISEGTGEPRPHLLLGRLPLSGVSCNDSECRVRSVKLTLPPLGWEVWSCTFLWFILHSCQGKLQISLYLKARKSDVSHCLSFGLKSRSSNLLHFPCYKKQKKENTILDTLVTATKCDKQKCYCILVCYCISLSLPTVCFFSPLCPSSAREGSLNKKWSWDGGSRLQPTALFLRSV